MLKQDQLIIDKGDDQIFSLFWIYRVWYFLAALSSTRSLVVGWFVRPSVGRLLMFVKKWPLEYQKLIKTYLCTYLRDSSHSSNSSDSSDKFFYD